MRQYRERAGLTQEELAAQAGLTEKAVGALERGERRTSYPRTVRALMHALQLTDAERATLLRAWSAAKDRRRAAAPQPHRSRRPMNRRARQPHPLPSFLLLRPLSQYQRPPRPGSHAPSSRHRGSAPMSWIVRSS